jgi:MFS family permease
VTTAENDRQPRGAFAALSSRSYRIYIGGQSLANTGSWMQSIAQDWLIFNLTHSSTAVGVTMALQFGPMLLLGLHAGSVADRLPKRRILLTTQSLNAAATLVLAAITISGAVRAADVYAFALLSGVIFAFDGPARQSFVTEVVPEGQLRAAISLNAAVFQATRLVGPAIASALIVGVGTGWVFAANAACYLGPTIGLLMLRPSDLQPAPPPPAAAGAVRAAARYVRGRPDVMWTIFLVGMLGTFGLNFPIVLTAMAKTTFGGNASTYGLFNIVLGLGSAAGAVFAGAGTRPRTRAIVGCAAVFGILQVAAALAPDLGVFIVLLVGMGFVNLVCQAMANASVQLSVDPELRGRVMGLYMLVFIGGTPVGAPVIGAVTSHFGARTGMLVCGVIPAMAAAVVAAAVARRTRDRKSAPSEWDVMETLLEETPALKALPAPRDRASSPRCENCSRRATAWTAITRGGFTHDHHRPNERSITRLAAGPGRAAPGRLDPLLDERRIRAPYLRHVGRRPDGRPGRSSPALRLGRSAFTDQ